MAPYTLKKVSHSNVRTIQLMMRPSTWLNVIHAFQRGIKGLGQFIGLSLSNQSNQSNRRNRGYISTLRLPYLKHCVYKRSKWRTLGKDEDKSE